LSRKPTAFVADPHLQGAYWSQIPNALRRYPNMDWTAKAVWIVLADYARTCEEVFVAKATICEQAGLGRTAVTKALSKLEELGYIRSTRRPGTSNVYEIRAIRYDGLPEIEPGRIATAPPAASRPPTRPHRDPDKEQGIQNNGSSSATADVVDDLGKCKQTYRSVAADIREIWTECSPGKKYAFSKPDGAIFSKIWDDCADLHEVSRVFSSAALRRESDPFWSDRWSPKFVYGQLSMLKNQGGQEAAGVVDEGSRVVSAAYESVLSFCSLYGVGRDDARGVLREAGLLEEDYCVPWLRKLSEGLGSAFWKRRFKQEERLSTLRAAVRAFASSVPKRGAAGLDSTPRAQGSTGGAFAAPVAADII
jgi:DNA-binding transcriptional ArsR family regulator